MPFKQEDIPWNKGRTDLGGYTHPPRSPEWCANLSASLKGTQEGSKNSFFGKHHTVESREQMGPTRDENPSYIAVHKRMLRSNSKIGKCVACKTFAGSTGYTGTQWALLHGNATHIDDYGREYSVNLEDYVEICRSCHKLYDNGENIDV